MKMPIDIGVTEPLLVANGISTKISYTCPNDYTCKYIWKQIWLCVFFWFWSGAETIHMDSDFMDESFQDYSWIQDFEADFPQKVSLIIRK